MFLLVGCGSSGGGASPAAAPSEPEAKSLFSEWESDTQPSALDLSLPGEGYCGQFGKTMVVRIVLFNTIECYCNVVPVGDEESGTVEATFCSRWGKGGPDALCATFDGTGTYQKTESELEFCFNGDCVNYR